MMVYKLKVLTRIGWIPAQFRHFWSPFVYKATSYSYAPANVTPKIKIHIEILSHAVCQ